MSVQAKYAARKFRSEFIDQNKFKVFKNFGGWDIV